MAYADILANQVITLDPMALTQSKRELLLSLMGNVNLIATNTNELNSEAQTKLNDLDSRLLAISNASSTSDADIQATLQAITDLQTDGSTGATIVGALGTLYSTLNSMERSHTFEKVINSATGKVDVDLTPYGFGAMTEYNVQVTASGSLPVTASYLKVSKNLVSVMVRDHTEWEFDEAKVQLKDCSTQNVVVSITISHAPTAITATFTEVDGDVTTIGDGAGQTQADNTAPDAPVANASDDGAGIVTVSGTAEAGSTVKVVFTDNSEKTVVADADGNYSVVNDNALTADGNIVVNATDEAGNVSVSTVIAYTVPADDNDGNEL